MDNALVDIISFGTFHVPSILVNAKPQVNLLFDPFLSQALIISKM
jgi:hypothetical protein